MIKSMTAFAGMERAVPGWSIGWEVRTVNHRFLDISLRLPESFRFMEPEVRSHIATYVKRGRVECVLAWKRVEEEAHGISFNRVLVSQLLAAVRAVESLNEERTRPLDALAVLQWPGVLMQPEADRELISREAISLLIEVLENLVRVRESEGSQLARFIDERCQQIHRWSVSTRERIPLVMEAIRERITARIGELTQLPERDRLEQELVYLAQKLDVIEELDRLETHVAEVQRVLRQLEPVGRRIDFLLQEMNREANTLGSKSADAETTRASVEIKVLIEQIREQVQNVE